MDGQGPLLLEKQTLGLSLPLQGCHSIRGGGRYIPILHLDPGATGLLAMLTGARRGEDSSGILITGKKKPTEITGNLKKGNIGLIFIGFGELSVFSPNSYMKALIPRETFGSYALVDR